MMPAPTAARISVVVRAIMTPLRAVRRDNGACEGASGGVARRLGEIGRKGCVSSSSAVLPHIPQKRACAGSSDPHIGHFFMRLPYLG